MLIHRLRTISPWTCDVVNGMGTVVCCVCDFRIHLLVQNVYFGLWWVWKSYQIDGLCCEELWNQLQPLLGRLPSLDESCWRSSDIFNSCESKLGGGVLCKGWRGCVPNRYTAVVQPTSLRMASLLPANSLLFFWSLRNVRLPLLPSHKCKISRLSVIYALQSLRVT
jgi:hypothetical protein